MVPFPFFIENRTTSQADTIQLISLVPLVRQCVLISSTTDRRRPCSISIANGCAGQHALAGRHIPTYVWLSHCVSFCRHMEDWLHDFKRNTLLDRVGNIDSQSGIRRYDNFLGYNNHQESLNTSTALTIRISNGISNIKRSGRLGIPVRGTQTSRQPSFDSSFFQANKHTLDGSRLERG